METRAMAIAFFYALGTGLGGIIGPTLFGSLIGSNSLVPVAWGYVLGAVLMAGAGIVELILGVNAEQKSLEEIAAPLSSDGADPSTRDGDAGAVDTEAAGESGQRDRSATSPGSSSQQGETIDLTRPRVVHDLRGAYPVRSRAVWSPTSLASSIPSPDPYAQGEIDRIVRALDEHGPLDRDALSDAVRSRYWGPGRFVAALALAQRRGYIRKDGRRYSTARSGISDSRTFDTTP
jgi:hypothetical protein